MEQIKDTKMNVSELKFHPRNERIYGDENVDQLMEDIKQNGLLSPLLTNTKLEVISGNRRLKALKGLKEDELKKMGLDEVPIRIKEYKSDEEQLIDLICANDQRDKSKLQKCNEGLEIEGIIKSDAKQRMLATLNNVMAGNSSLASQNFNERGVPQKGRTDDIIAAFVKLPNGAVYRQGKKVALNIKEYLKQGDDKKVQCLSELFEHNTSMAALSVDENILDKSNDIKDWKQLQSDARKLKKELSSNTSKQSNPAFVSYNVAHTDALETVKAQVDTLKSLVEDKLALDEKPEDADAKPAPWKALSDWLKQCPVLDKNTPTKGQASTSTTEETENKEGPAKSLGQ